MKEVIQRFSNKHIGIAVIAVLIAASGLLLSNTFSGLTDQRDIVLQECEYSSSGQTYSASCKAEDDSQLLLHSKDQIVFDINPFEYGSELDWGRFSKSQQYYAQWAESYSEEELGASVYTENQCFSDSSDNRYHYIDICGTEEDINIWRSNYPGSIEGTLDQEELERGETGLYIDINPILDKVGRTGTCQASILIENQDERMKQITVEGNAGFGGYDSDHQAVCIVDTKDSWYAIEEEGTTVDFEYSPNFDFQPSKPGIGEESFQVEVSSSDHSSQATVGSGSVYSKEFSIGSASSNFDKEEGVYTERKIYEVLLKDGEIQEESVGKNAGFSQQFIPGEYQYKAYLVKAERNFDFKDRSWSTTSTSVVEETEFDFTVTENGETGSDNENDTTDETRLEAFKNWLTGLFGGII